MPKLATKPAPRTNRPSMVDTPEEAETLNQQIQNTPLDMAPTASSSTPKGGSTTEPTEEPAPAKSDETAEPETPPKVEGIVEPEVKKAPPRRPGVAKKPAPKATADGGMFTSLSDVDEKFNVLMWGREGSSKTTALAEAANYGRILVINAEGGLKTKALQRQGINTDNIAVWPKPGQPITYEGLDEVYREVQSDLQKDPNAWFLVGFDSATDIVQSMVDNVSDDRIQKARDRGATVDIFDQFTTDRNDYGVMSKQFRDLLRKFRDLQVHVVITALERRDVDEDTSQVVYGPSVSPALQTDLLGYVDIVLYFRAADPDKDYFRAATKKAGKFRSKDRIGNLPPVLVNPTFGRILAYATDELTAETDPVQEVIAQQEAAKLAAAKEREEKKLAAKGRTRPVRETAAQKKAREESEAAEDAKSDEAEAAQA